jgi:hypothetical protein
LNIFGQQPVSALRQSRDGKLVVSSDNADWYLAVDWASIFINALSGLVEDRRPSCAPVSFHEIGSLLGLECVGISKAANTCDSKAP